MKRGMALILAFLLVLALAGCKKEADGGTAPTEGSSVPGTDAPTGGPSVPGPTAPQPTDPTGGTEPATPPPAGGPDALKLGLMPDASALGAAGLYGGGYTLVTGVTEPGKALQSGSLDAAIVPVDTAARLYVETDGKVRIAAVTASGGWGIIERGNAVHNIWDLAAKTVWVPVEYPGAMELFAYIAERYDFIVGDTLKLESVPVSELARYDLALMPAQLAGITRVRDADTHEALDVGEEWTEVTGDAFLPGACLVVSENVTDGELEALRSALKVSQETVSDNLDKAVALGLAENQEEAWASLECLSFMWLEGADTIREELSGYFSVLYQIDPDLIGGFIPDDGFYR